MGLGGLSLIAAFPRGASSFGLPSGGSSLKEGPGSRADALMFPPPHNATCSLVPRLYSLPVPPSGNPKPPCAVEKCACYNLTIHRVIVCRNYVVGSNRGLGGSHWRVCKRSCVPA